MKFAPVIIPTVSRYKHLKNCLESLANCTWADQTDVFIAVDYPAKKEHWEGYNHIKEYLSTCGDLGFHSLNYIFRDHNYFYSGEGNASSLINELLVTYDRYIFSEDDNVFSPNFLVYINKGLDLFEKDRTVLAINGYRHFYPIKFLDNSFFRQNVDFSAWGYGISKDRVEQVLNPITPQYFRNKISWQTFWRLKNNGNNRLIRFLKECFFDKTVITDNTLSVIMPLEKMDVIMPNHSLVRNTGWDNSGVNCSSNKKALAERHLTQSISNDFDFDFKGSGYEFYSENKRIYVKNSYGRTSNFQAFKETLKFLAKRVYYRSLF